MRSKGLNLAGCFVFAACSCVAGPALAQDPPQYELLVPPNEAPQDLKDVALANNPRRIEHSMSVAANPKNPNLLVVALNTCTLLWEGCRSIVKRSQDAGRTWSQPVTLPCTSACGGAALAYAPDGNRVYAAYSNSPNSDATDIVVSRSDDTGATWQGPVVALAGNWAWYRSPGIATSLSESESRWIYVTGRKSYGDPSGDFDFTRSADFGVTWSTPKRLGDWTSEWRDGLTGGTVAGGKAGEVLVAGPGTSDFGISQDLWVVRSQDHGGTFATVVAAREYPSSIDVKVGHKGAAHIVYERYVDDEPNGHSDIAYIWSPGPPYSTWSEAVTVNDDRAGRWQSNPSLTTQKCGASTVLHLVWVDPRLRPMAPPDDHNSGFHDHYWDVFYARKIAKSGASWSKNVRVSGKSSFMGADGLVPDVAASQGRAVAVWTDRRDNTDPYDYETDAYASGILSGVRCP